MAGQGKRYEDAAKKVDRFQFYTPQEAVALLRETSKVKFDPTVEVHIRTGVDPRHADQMVRGSGVLPAGTGKKVRVLAFAQGEKAREAEEAGADFVGGDDLAKRIQEGWLEFDVAVATPDMMGVVGRLGRVLGPRGLMPNPKTGRVRRAAGRGGRESKAARLEYRTDRGATVRLRLGKKPFEEKALLENYATVV